MKQVLAVPGYFACCECRSMMPTSGLTKDPSWLAIQCTNRQCGEFGRLYKVWVPLADVELMITDDIRWLAKT